LFSEEIYSLIISVFTIYHLQLNINNMVRAVLTYGPTSPPLREDLSSLTGRLVSVRVVWGPSCLASVNYMYIYMLSSNLSLCILSLMHLFARLH